MKSMTKFSVILFVVLAGCAEKDNDAQSRNIQPNSANLITSEKHKFSLDTITTELSNPWGIAFLPDGRILVTERAGEIMIVEGGRITGKVEGVPKVYAQGQGGLLDIQLHPEYSSNGWIYLTYAKPGSGGGGTTLARTKIEGNKFTGLQELFSAQPFTSSGAHFGSRIAFDGKGYVFISSGERGAMENAQNLGNHLGKVIRLHDDGKVPADNPFVNTAGAKPEIWSYGHRNPQGMIYDKKTNTLWAHEHGPRGGDELNIVVKGKNYGWPKITYGINYNGDIISNKTTMEGMEQPVTYWVPSIAPCGMAIVTSDKFPQWQGNLLVGALSFQHVARVELNNGKYVAQEKLLDKVARVRAIAEAPDGSIYVATEGPGMLLRLTAGK